MLFVRNIGDIKLKVDAIYLSRGSVGILIKRTDITLNPGEVSKIIVDSFSLRRVSLGGSREYYIKLGSETSVEAVVEIPKEAVSEALNRQPPPIKLVAKISQESDDQHWVIIDYSSSYFTLDGNYGKSGDPMTGYAPVLTNIDEYTITTEWVGWEDKP